MKISFDPTGYKSLLKTLVSNYQIVTFSQATEMTGAVTGVCCLRHDIDYCLDSGLKMAAMEKDNNIFSSYFFLLDSDYYNVLSNRSSSLISAIAQMGHEIALHFDIAKYPIEKHKEKIDHQISILEDVSGKKIKSLSYHNPTIFGMEKISKGTTYCNYLSTYSASFNKNFYYASDSLCSFRDTELLTKIHNKAFTNLHLLIHPVWWSNTIDNRDSKVKFVADSVRDHLFDVYCEVVKEYEHKKNAV